MSSSIRSYYLNRLLPVGALALAVFAGAAVAQKKEDENIAAVQAPARALAKAFRHAAEVATPTVVKIQSHTVAKNVKSNGGIRGKGENPFNGTPFEEFFNNQTADGQPGNQFGGMMPRRDSIGSGVIIDKSGIVLTNNHVVEGADEITVKLTDGREFKATDIKTDPSSDIAVLRIKSNEPLPTAKLADSDAMEIGDWVIAVGAPFELESTVSHGIISAKGRELSSNKRSKFFQTDAAINPGNSGGPLCNLDGDVIGINTAIATESGSFAGIGFAIPSNQAKWIATQLMDKGSVQRAYLGVAIEEVTNDLAAKFGVKHGEGVLVGDVFPHTPAAEAGFQEGDLIKSFGGQAVHSPRELQENVERARIDSKVSVEVLRDGKAKTLTVVAKALPDKFGMAERNSGRGHNEDSSSKSYHAEKLGLTVADLTKQDADQYGYKATDGVLVQKVDADGKSADKGIREGMVIRKVGKMVVHNTKEFEDSLAKESLKDGILLQVRTPNGSRFVVVQEG